MEKTSALPSENERIKTLRSLKILDTLPEERFDRITKFAQRLFSAPIALITLVDQNRIWVKSKHGIDVKIAPRDGSFCDHTIAGNDDLLVVSDATKDSRFTNYPWVKTAPNIKFYAGCALLAPNGQKIGTLCIMDPKERTLNHTELQMMRDLANLVEKEITSTQQTLDEFTGVNTRDSFLLFLEHFLRFARRTQCAVSMLVLDIVNLDQIYNTHGRVNGDKTLVETARVLTHTFRESDFIARTGVRQFCVLLPFSGEDSRAKVLDRLEYNMRSHSLKALAALKPAWNVGLIPWGPTQPCAVEELMKQAQSTMDHAETNPQVRQIH